MSESAQDESVEHVMVQMEDRQLRQRLSRAIRRERAAAKRDRRAVWWSGVMFAVSCAGFMYYVWVMYSVWVVPML